METDLQIVHAGLLPTVSSVTDADMILIVQAKRLKRALPSAMKGEKGDKGDRVMMRLGDTAIQWQYEGNETWKDLITYEKIQEPAKATIEAAQKATNDAIAAETARRNSWAVWFENATTGVKAIWSKWFGTTKSDWNSFNTAANQAESSRATEYASLREDIVAKTEAADEAAAYANEMADHTPIIGEDGYWYRWDAEQDVYVKTDDYAKGGADYPVFGLDVETMNVTVDAVISNDRYAVTDDGVLVVLF